LARSPSSFSIASVPFFVTSMIGIKLMTVGSYSRA
jgi:hypothetical protein